MAVLVEAGRIAIAESLIIRPLHIAWGIGDGAWSTAPSEDIEQASLEDEVGRRLVLTPQFVVPDEEGSIVLPSGSFAVSGTPTNHLYCSAEFDFADASSAVIREFAIFIGTETDEELPPGQEYFLPEDIVSPGRLLYLQNIAPLYRSPAIKETAKFVISF